VRLVSRIMLPSEYVAERVGAPTPDWIAAMTRAIRDHGKVVAPEILQRFLVRELLLDQNMVRQLLGDRISQQAAGDWLGEAMLVTLPDGQTTGALLFFKSKPASVTLTLPTSFLKTLFQTDTERLTRVSRLFTEGTDIRLSPGEYLVPSDAEIRIAPL